MAKDLALLARVSKGDRQFVQAVALQAFTAMQGNAEELSPKAFTERGFLVAPGAITPQNCQAKILVVTDKKEGKGIRLAVEKGVPMFSTEMKGQINQVKVVSTRSFKNNKFCFSQWITESFVNQIGLAFPRIPIGLAASGAAWKIEVINSSLSDLCQVPQEAAKAVTDLELSENVCVNTEELWKKFLDHFPNITHLYLKNVCLNWVTIDTSTQEYLILVEKLLKTVADCCPKLIYLDLTESQFWIPLNSGKTTKPIIDIMQKIVQHFETRQQRNPNYSPVVCGIFGERLGGNYSQLQAIARCFAGVPAEIEALTKCDFSLVSKYCSKVTRLTYSNPEPLDFDELSTLSEPVRRQITRFGFMSKSLPSLELLSGILPNLRVVLHYGAHYEKVDGVWSRQKLQALKT